VNKSVIGFWSEAAWPPTLGYFWQRLVTPVSFPFQAPFSMQEVEVLFMVTRNGGGTREERIKTRVDSATLGAASGELVRRKLDGWAKQFFPADKEARGLYMKRL
jgi:hypothetical protein